MLIRAREFFNRPRGRWLLEQAVGVCVALLIVGGLTALLTAAFLWLPIEHITIVYLIPVIVVALRWGAIPAVCAGIAAIVAAAFFFYAPYYDLRVHSPAQVVDIVLFIIVATITGRVAVAVRRAKIRAQAESLRDALIGSVSHELRTPLASIVGSASILAKAPAIVHDGSLAALVAILRHEADRLNGDIENLLDATRISSDGIEPRTTWIDPEDIVSGVLARKRQLLDGREVVIEVADDLPLLQIDATLVESALGQIVENAAKYSAPGTPVTISATHGRGVVLIKVDDQGEGLAYGEAEKIFERFYRGARHAGQIPGSGLGLWIARALIEACGGSVRAFSAGPKRGTTIQIELPVKTQPADDEHADD